MKDPADTICALSTPPGRSGIAVVRMSGSQSFAFFRGIFQTAKASETIPYRRAMLGHLREPLGGSEIDEAVATCFPSPNSYTGEDMVEFSMHGSPVLVEALLDGLCSLGARLAEPGEFTMRAFLNGRMNLTQAEAVNDIINAATLFQAQVAARQHSGALAGQLKPLKELLLEIIVNLESAIEFSEEDLPVESAASLGQKLERLRQKISEWIDTYRRGRIIREGFSLALAGRPNVGKSSVFNALLNRNRSIVAELPGTTRDLVSEITSLDGIPVRLQDTAGIHSAGDHIEKLGIDKSFEAIADADAILLVVDLSQSCTPQDLELRRQLTQFSCISVMNKSDLDSKWTTSEIEAFAGNWPYIEVSAKTGAGIPGLRTAILDGLMGAGGAGREAVLITNLRHLQSLEGAKRDLESAAKALKDGFSEEFALADLHNGLKKLGSITGETSAEDLLTEIFSRFCVGK
jgi:tRNA modification GTPase